MKTKGKNMEKCMYCDGNIVQLNIGKNGKVWVHKRRGYLTAPDLADRIYCKIRTKATPKQDLKELDTIIANLDGDPSFYRKKYEEWKQKLIPIHSPSLKAGVSLGAE